MKNTLKVKDSLGQDVSIRDILMLSFSYTNRSLEPALLIGFAPLCKIAGSNYVELSILMEDLDLRKITEHKLSILASEDNSEAWIESGIKINNPEFFIHDERISKLLSERPDIIAK
jgi:hypothetical protein